MSSSVLLSNVDDYLAPSQACVNPLFSTDKPEKEDESVPVVVDAPAVVVPKQRKRRGGARTGASVVDMAATRPAAPAIPSDPVKASIADCLACSGCVTTAETVLIEQQHSLTVLREMMQRPDADRPEIVMTISPASWADLLRHLGVQSECSNSSSTSTDTGSASQAGTLIEANKLLMYQQKLTTLLQRALCVQVVLDGNLPLQWSLHQAADEFCQAYKFRNDAENAMDVNVGECERLQQELTPSMALSSSQALYMLKDGTTRPVSYEKNVRQQQALPIITSSCPAVVCLVEKSTHEAVPHLSTTKSPMAAAGAYWKQQHEQKGRFHLGIMPCHDKKLEASRKDLQQDTSAGEVKDVDMVITTQECFQLLQEFIETKGAGTGTMSDTDDSPVDAIRKYLESLPLAPIQHQLPGTISDSDSAVLISPSSLQVPPSPSTTRETEFFPLGSGGHADYIFRYAALHLFGVQLDEVPWRAVTVTGPRRATSARVASSQRRRDFYQATMYRCSSGGVVDSANNPSYSCEAPTVNTPSDWTPVLKFAVAYGMQTIQRVLQPFQTPLAESSPYDYIEAMACPSGCLNGGGQLRLAERETPTETRERVTRTQQFFTTTRAGDSPVLTGVDLPTENLLTSFHVVPPLAHSLGAAAGVAVKDTQW